MLRSFPTTMEVCVCCSEGGADTVWIAESADVVTRGGASGGLCNGPEILSLMQEDEARLGALGTDPAGLLPIERFFVQLRLERKRLIVAAMDIMKLWQVAWWSRRNALVFPHAPIAPFRRLDTYAGGGY